MNKVYIETLQTRIDTLTSSIHNLTERREALIAEHDDAMRQVFEAETGLHYGDELDVTAEFVQFENARGNDGRVWGYYVEHFGGSLRVYAGSAEYFAHHGLRVEHGGTSVGGVPVDLVQRMRQAWLEKHPQPA